MRLFQANFFDVRRMTNAVLPFMRERKAGICVLFTANDAHMRDRQVVVPSSGVASNEVGDRYEALALMRRGAKADTPPASGSDFAHLAAG